MVRQREFNPNTVLTGAMQVFTSRGYSNTSIDDIVKATGVSRYGIYGTFGNKRELFELALQRYTEQMGKASFMRLYQPDSSIKQIRQTYTDRIEQLFSGDEKNACLVVSTAMELAPRDKEIEMMLNKLLKQMSKSYVVGLTSALAKGEVKEDLDLEDAGQYLTGAFFGLAVMARCGFSKDVLESYVDSTIAAVAS